MNEIKHTPGRWTADLHHVQDYAGRSHAFIRAENRLVPLAAVVLAAEGCDEAEGRANANVLAAASDLLEALKQLVERVDRNGGIGEYKGGPAFVMANARTAITKATTGGKL